MNLKHLFYFWKVATHGGVVRASEMINITPQTLSTQIKLLEDRLGSPLFVRRGRTLDLTDAGRLALEYAEEIFALDAELEQVVRNRHKVRPTEFSVGVSDAIPKALAFQFLRPAQELTNQSKIICKEWRLDRLLGELAINRLDLVISDSLAPPNLNMRIHHHRLAESGFCFMASAALVKRASGPFPANLNKIPLLVPSSDSMAGRSVVEWLNKRRINANIAGIFDDTALMAEFGREGVGAFPIPNLLRREYETRGGVKPLGQLDDIAIEYFALSTKRKITHPCVQAIVKRDVAGS